MMQWRSVEQLKSAYILSNQVSKGHRARRDDAQAAIDVQ
jgi:hypothetical protein